MKAKFIILLMSILYTVTLWGQAPKSFAERLEPVGKILDISDQGYVTWSMAPIYGPDGKVHVFFTKIPNSDGNWMKNHKTMGHIGHAVADKPEGPYTILEDIPYKGRKGPGHWDGNGVPGPRIYKIDNKYLLFFTAYEVPWPLEKMKEHIGFLISDDLKNWRLANHEQPVLSPDTTSNDAWDKMIVNNASFVKNPVNNQFWLYYRGMKSLNQWNIGLAISDTLEATYIRHCENPIISVSKMNDRFHIKKNFVGFEDPVVWYENGRFCMLVKDGGYLDAPGGCYMESKDGIQWSEPVRGWYSPSFYLKEEGSKLESPQLLLNDRGEPEYIFFNRYIEKNQKSSGFVFKVRK